MDGIGLIIIEDRWGVVLVGGVLVFVLIVLLLVLVCWLNVFVIVFK